MNRSIIQTHTKFYNNAVTALFSDSYQDTLDEASLTPDLILKIGLEKQEFYCHRLVLAASSDFLQTIIATATPGIIPVILLPDLNPIAIEFVLIYIYYGEVQVPATQYTDFVEACKLLDLKSPTDQIQLVEHVDDQGEIEVKLEPHETNDNIETVELIGTNDNLSEYHYVKLEEVSGSKSKRKRKKEKFKVGKINATPEVSRIAQERLIQAIKRAYTSLGIVITDDIERNIAESRIIIENHLLIRGIHNCGLCDINDVKKQRIRYKIFSSDTGCITFLTDTLKIHMKKRHPNSLNVA